MVGAGLRARVGAERQINLLLRSNAGTEARPHHNLNFYAHEFKII